MAFFVDHESEKFYLRYTKIAYLTFYTEANIAMRLSKS